MVRTVLVAAGINASKQARLRGTKSGFEKLGFKVFLFNYKKFHLDYFNASNVFWNKQLFDLAKKIKPDLLYVIKGERLLPGLIRKIKKLGMVTANRTVDDLFGVHNPYMKIINIAEYDYIFNYDRYIVDELKKRHLNAFYLPCAAAIDFYKPKKLKKEFDVSFVGSHYKDRENHMKQLMNFDINIWGPRWPNIKGKLRKHVHSASSYERRYVEIMNKSKITLNWHHMQTIVAANFRVFEAPACKTFLLTDHTKDMPNLFKLGKEMVCFRNMKELKELVQYYLENEKERNKIAEAGYRRVLKEHTQHHRIKKVVKTIFG